METITVKEFTSASGVEGWRAGVNGASIEYRTGDFATGARLFASIAELADAARHHPDVDIRYASVQVRLFTHSARGLTTKDVALAQQISVAARELELEAETVPREHLMVAVATPDASRIMPFWRAATGYTAISDIELVDPDGRGSLIWLQPVDKPMGGRMHIDVVVAPDAAEARVAAALAAGGVIADDTHAPEWWTLADADGHKIDICPSRT
ncbi:4a-hydroxytetrahydrobiopterin dehydratase [Microbacterium pumilum]|uniref:Putative pterin-4-alpha-carbinolamine dehydratase n=1 Tax=Microbacterium pumilum TaxID=344165 RepID=A0ABN2STC6_9MICO